MSAKGAKSSDSSKKPSISAKIRCTLSPQGQRNQIKKGKSGRRLQNIDIQIKAEDVDLFDVDEDGNLSFMLALAPLDDLPERSEVIRLVQEAIEKKEECDGAAGARRGIANRARPPADRASASNFSLILMKRLWTETGAFDFEGQYFQIQGAYAEPNRYRNPTL